MKIRFFAIVTLVLSVLAFGTALAQSYNYEEMTQEQYNAYLAEWQNRLNAAQGGISDEDAKIEELKKQLDQTQGEIDQTWNEIFTIAGQSKEQYNDYLQQLQQLKNDANALLNLSAEDLYSRMNEVDALQKKLDDLKKNPLSATSESAALIASIENLLSQCKEKGKSAVPPSYTVLKGDCLWKIAAKPDIYGDGYAWMRIYTTNREQIKDPNLIYAKQIFMIPRGVGPDEHLVVKGEHLSKIAGYSNVYGSPFKWNKLYEANKASISDPNLIFPYQVLKIAR